MCHGFGTAPSFIVSSWGMCRELVVSGMMQELKQHVGGAGDGEGGKFIHNRTRPCSNLTVTLMVPVSFCTINSCNHLYNPHTKQIERYDPFGPVLVSFVSTTAWHNEDLVHVVIMLSTGMCRAGTSAGLITCCTAITKGSGARS